jgi:hypothetical protein
VPHQPNQLPAGPQHTVYGLALPVKDHKYDTVCLEARSVSHSEPACGLVAPRSELGSEGYRDKSSYKDAIYDDPSQ